MDKLRKGTSAFVTPIKRERKTSKTLGYFRVESMFHQSQGQKALELITGKHGFVFSKYKVEAKDIIFDTKKENHLKVQKSRKFLLFLFLHKPLVRSCLEHCV